MSVPPTSLQLDALRQALPRLFGDLDETAFAAIRPHLDWKWVERTAGEALFTEGEPSDAVYVVISGRLQASVRGANGVTEIVGEISRGEPVGEMAVFTGEPQRATVTALRDSVLARIELTALQEILMTLPSLALSLNRVIIERLQRWNTSQKATRNVTNLAVLSVSEGLRPVAVLSELLPQLQRQKQTALHLTSQLIDSTAGRPGAAQATAAEPEAHRWLVNYLDEMEARYSLVFYETDATPTAWTRRCLRQADEVLLLAMADSSPKLSATEQVSLTGPEKITRARQTLVLLHRARRATHTAEFLRERPGVDRHYHLCDGDENDMARLARLVSGNAVGLVLGGGGARGIAHIGVLRALAEAGVPIDAVGGTSIGSVLGACIASGWGWERVHQETRREFLANPTSDYNFLPLVSLLAGRKLRRILTTIFGETRVEELWLPFFCVSGNFTRAGEVVHTRGDLKRALLASMALPGIFPPVVSGNDFLVDGGVFNIMPVDVMARTGVNTILAVDLRPDDTERRELTFDEVPGTWALLLDRLKSPAARRYQIPSMITMMMRANTLNGQQKKSQVIADVDVLFNPDVRRFGLLEWKSYDLLVEEGYRHAQEVLAKQPWPFEFQKV